jgi:hypothetical protein
MVNYRRQRALDNILSQGFNRFSIFCEKYFNNQVIGKLNGSFMAEWFYGCIALWLYC